MKRFLSLFILAIALAIDAAHVHAGQEGLTGAQQFIKTNTATGTPVALAAAGTYASKVTLIGNKTARSANTGDVYIGPTSTNDAQPIKIGSGAEVVITAPPGEWIDLSEWYLDVTSANDGVVVIYSQ